MAFALPPVDILRRLAAHSLKGEGYNARDYVNSIIDELHDQVDGNFERMRAMLMEMAQRPHSPVLMILVTSALQTRL